MERVKQMQNIDYNSMSDENKKKMWGLRGVGCCFMTIAVIPVCFYVYTYNQTLEELEQSTTCNAPKTAEAGSEVVNVNEAWTFVAKYGLYTTGAVAIIMIIRALLMLCCAEGASLTKMCDKFWNCLHTIAGCACLANCCLLPNALFSYAGVQCYEPVVAADGTVSVDGPLVDEAGNFMTIWIVMIVCSTVLPILLLIPYCLIAGCIFAAINK